VLRSSTRCTPESRVGSAGNRVPASLNEVNPDFPENSQIPGKSEVNFGYIRENNIYKCYCIYLFIFIIPYYFINKVNNQITFASDCVAFNEGLTLMQGHPLGVRVLHPVDLGEVNFNTAGAWHSCRKTSTTSLQINELTTNRTLTGTEQLSRQFIM
jgi:hypothetical protein